MSPGRVRNDRSHRLTELQLRHTNTDSKIAKKIRRNFVAFAISASIIWFILVALSWALISFVWNPPQMHSPEVRVAYVQLALGLAAGGAAVFAIYAGLLALSEQIGLPELCLHVSYRGRSDSPEHHVVFDGDPPLEGPGRPKPNTDIELALMNYSNFPATEVTVLLKGNNGSMAKHSGYFAGPERELFDIISTNWRAKDGAVIPPKPKYEPIDKAKVRAGRIPSDVLMATWLELGAVRWERDEGTYWLQIKVFAKNMPTPASFKIALKAGPAPTT